MDKKFKQIYYSDDGYWRGKSAIQKLARASGSMKEEAEKWLLKQPLYQIYLPAPKYVPRPNASISSELRPGFQGIIKILHIYASLMLFPQAIRTKLSVQVDDGHRYVTGL